MLNALFAFIMFFRPALLRPNLPSTLIILPFVLIYYFNFENTRKTLSKIGFSLTIAILFILLWSFFIDIITGQIVTMGLRSQFATNIRFVLYILIANFFVSILSKNNTFFAEKSIIYAIFLQNILAFVMLFNLDIKIFFYKYISGYNGSEKIFRDNFFDVRIFGWSEEMFYTAPAFMLLATLMILRKNSLKSSVFKMTTFLVSIINARISIVSLIFLAENIKVMLFVFALSATILAGIVLIYPDIIAQTQSILDYILDDFSGGGSRTYDILLGHIHFPTVAWNWIFGSGEYLYGDNADQVSDIGYIILLNYGGLIYLSVWMFILYRIITRSTNILMEKILLLLIFSLLAFKGQIFSGNACTMLMLVFFFIRFNENVLVRSKMS